MMPGQKLKTAPNIMDIRIPEIKKRPQQAPPASETSDAANLGRFVSECQQVDATTGESQQIGQLARLLLKHANAKIVLEITPGSTPSVSPNVRIVTSHSETCPTNVEQWAVSTAIKAITTGNVVTESTQSAKGQTISMISAPLPTSDTHSRSVLSTLIFGSSKEASLPFIQVVRQCVVNGQARNHLLAAQQTSLDVASLQEISLAVADCESLQTGCRKLANQLKTQIECSNSSSEANDHSTPTVYVGITGNNGFPKLTSISDCDSLPENERVVEAVEAAMAECISRNANGHWPPCENNFALLCHQTLSNVLQNRCLASYLLPDGKGTPLAVIVVESETPLTERANHFLSAGQNQLGVALSLVRRGESNKLQRCFDSIKKSFTQKKTLTVLKIVAAILMLGMIPTPYQIRATSEVQPAKKKFLYAPFAAPLKESLVEPGDLVRKNAELARLDDKELYLELAEVQAELHRTQKELDGYVATHKAGEARMAQHESEMLQARLEILEQRSEQLVLRSPIDGIVIAGDWKNAAGMPLETGESLFEVAPLEELSIDVYLPDEEIRYARPGQHVRIKFDAYPFESFHGELESIHPAAEIKDSANVFIGTVKITNPDGKLRPGMKGTAHCNSSWQPIWWNLLHKPAAKCMRYFGW